MMVIAVLNLERPSGSRTWLYSVYSLKGVNWERSCLNRPAWSVLCVQSAEYSKEEADIKPPTFTSIFTCMLVKSDDRLITADSLVC